jgi:hypothetical protein
VVDLTWTRPTLPLPGSVDFCWLASYGGLAYDYLDVLPGSVAPIDHGWRITTLYTFPSPLPNQIAYDGSDSFIAFDDPPTYTPILPFIVPITA